MALLVPVGLLVIVSQFDGLYGQDPYAYYAYATGPLRVSLLSGRLWPPPPFFWPPGYPLLMSALSLVIGATPGWIGRHYAIPDYCVRGVEQSLQRVLPFGAE